MKLIDCPACGRLNGSETSLCVGCGMSLNNDPVESQGRSVHRQERVRESPKQIPNSVRVGLEIGCVALLVIFSFVAWRNAGQLGKVQELLSTSETEHLVIKNRINDIELASDRSKFRVNELSNIVEDGVGELNQTISTQKDVASLRRDLQEIKSAVDKTDNSLYSISGRVGKLELDNFNANKSSGGGTRKSQGNQPAPLENLSNVAYAKSFLRAAIEGKRETALAMLADSFTFLGEHVDVNNPNNRPGNLMHFMTFLDAFQGKNEWLDSVNRSGNWFINETRHNMEALVFGSPESGKFIFVVDSSLKGGGIISLDFTED